MRERETELYTIDVHKYNAILTMSRNKIVTAVCVSVYLCEYLHVVPAYFALGI